MNKTNLTDTQKRFLTNYSPSHRSFTTWDEVNKIVMVLELDKMSLEEMRKCRNNVVMFYTTLSNESQDGIAIMNSTISMMSVTATIDHYSKGYTA